MSWLVLSLVNRQVTVESSGLTVKAKLFGGGWRYECTNFSLSLLARFMHQPIQVNTPLGVFSGVLRRTETSQQGGIGCLLLETREGWLLLKAWTAVKRRV
jgi:hypothetical protein